MYNNQLAWILLVWRTNANAIIIGLGSAWQDM